MQTLWDCTGFSLGYTTKNFLHYFEELAQWKALGDLKICDPTTPVQVGDPYDISTNFSRYFQPAGKPGNTTGYVTNHLSEGAGFRLVWSMPLRALKIEPGQWNEPAPLPETTPEDFLFWYCTSPWSPIWGGGLLVTPREGEAREFRYSGADQRCALIHNMPHVLLPISKAAARPYYCFYGQLQEEK